MLSPNRSVRASTRKAVFLRECNAQQEGHQAHDTKHHHRCGNNGGGQRRGRGTRLEHQGVGPRVVVAVEVSHRLKPPEVQMDRNGIPYDLQEPLIADKKGKVEYHAILHSTDFNITSTIMPRP